MPTGESISEAFVLKNPPTVVVRSVTQAQDTFNDIWGKAHAGMYVAEQKDKMQFNCGEL